MCVSTITKKKGSRNIKLEYISAYENSWDKFDIERCQIKVKLSSHMCDTTRHDTTRQHATRHDRGPRHDDFLVWCHTYHDTTMPLDSDSLQTPWQFCGVQLITRLFTRG